MKSQLFKTAWTIFRNENVSFSDALKLAWEKTRQGLKAVVLKLNKLVKSAGLGYETVNFTRVEFQNIENKIVSVNNDGARFDYGFGLYNGD